MSHVRTLRPALAALTDALDRRDPLADHVFVDPSTLAVVVDSSLDDADDRGAVRGWEIPCPDGLWEWQVRRDFVRALPRGRARTRLGATLAGPKTRRRFEVSLAALGGSAHADFARWRRRRLRHYASRVLRVALAVAPELLLEADANDDLDPATREIARLLHPHAPGKS